MRFIHSYSAEQFNYAYWILSNCSTAQAISEKAVNEVFEKCFTDELPFKTGKPVIFDKNLK